MFILWVSLCVMMLWSLGLISYYRCHLQQHLRFVVIHKGYIFVVSHLIVLCTDNLPFFIFLTVYQDLVILSKFDNEVDRVCDPEMVVNNHESKFEASHQLHIIRELHPVIEKHNIEKMIELDIEAKVKGWRSSYTSCFWIFINIQCVQYKSNMCAIC